MPHKIWLHFVITNLVLAFAQTVSASGPIFAVRISALHPTQMNIGKVEAESKADQLKSMSDKERDAYLRVHPVPVVIGPSGRLYLVDHHHLCDAMLSIGKKHVYATVIESLGGLSETGFWQRMQELKKVYLKDKGRPIVPAELPDSIGKLGDDPFRSVAGGVRKQRGFVKIDVPYFEFEWADFFRTRLRLPSKPKKADFKRAIREGVTIALSPQASHLPGYRFRCESLFASP